jgi:hypothetical protein
VLLEWQAELEVNLGPVGPNLAAATMHPEVWQAAQSLWSSDHFGDAAGRRLAVSTLRCRRRSPAAISVTPSWSASPSV